ncbi:MAG TPA: hypothetical protein VLA74_02575 [Nitrososphaeraceae archaeon]|nr:hypothetical protein [Nitrososphaeraceae archaeon]
MDNNLIKNNNKEDTNSDTNNLTGIEGGNIDISTSKKISILNQLHPQVREELSKHDWEIISYNPPKFLVAHLEHKQIIFAELKEKDVKRRKNSIVGATIENDTNETISYLKFSRIVIGAIPIEVILNKNPLGLFDQKYIIKFVTHTELSFTIGPKTLDEILSCLKDRSLIYMPIKATEALSIIINAFQRNGKLIVKDDMETTGFYFIDGEIKQYTNNYNSNPKPTFDQIKKCCELLDILQIKFKNKDVFPTLLKWSIVAPFDYVLKQVHKKWIPWLYAYGWANTGKSTLGDICCCIWNRYQDKDSILPFTAADTKARLGEILSKSTYPIVINEVAQLNDENRNKDMVEMYKIAITDLTSRKKIVNKTNYTDIPSFSPCILTSNSSPPSDTGFRRRIIPIVFTEKDQYSEGEMKDFKELFDQLVKHELRYLGDFTVNYIMEHQELLLDGKKDWKEIAEIILTEMYKSVHREPSEWIKYFVKENQMADSKEDINLLFRSFLINVVNETYNKYYRNIEKDNDVPNLPFSSRLNFCLDHKLIPFLNPVTTNNKNSNDEKIIITSDLIHELKKKIPQISSLNEIAAIIEGFEYGQKRINGKNIRTVFGTKNQLLDFLWLE